MDITIDTTEKKPTKKYLMYGAAVLVLVFLVFSVKNYLGGATAFVDTESLRIAEVKRGAFQVSVRGVGVLKPRSTVFLASRVAGRVETIYVRAGAQVKQGDPILKLNNPLLEQAAVSAQSDLTRAVAEHKATLANLESSLLDAESQVARAEMTYKGDKLELDAQERLRKLGNSTVSQIDYQRTDFKVKSSKLDWELQQKRLAKLRINVDAQKQAQQAKEIHLQNELDRAKEQVEVLTVRASVDGVLQSMDLEIGQDLAMGGSVGKLADPSDLLAEIDIQELQIKDVVLGQVVNIDTRKSQISGKVTRIDPQVVKGLVKVEVELEGQLPNEARPELSVEGVIMVTNKNNALFVRKPQYAEAYKTARVFRVSDDGNLAEAIRVQFGQSSVNDIEITSGLKKGDRIIVSATDSFSDNEEVLLN